MEEFFTTCDIHPKKLPTYKTTHHGSKFTNDEGEPKAPQLEMPKFTELVRAMFQTDITEKLPIRDPLVDFEIGPGIRDWWFGHATNLIQINETFIITDPVFDNNASPIPGNIRRVVPVPREIKDLPKISYVLISHCHWDHLCKASIKELYERNPDCNFFVPLRVASYLTDWGVKNVTEFDWRTNVEIDGIEFTCLPAHHGSARWGPDKDKTLWCSWMIRKDNVLIYYSGDTAVGPHFKEAYEIFGRGPDLMLVGIGPQNPQAMMRSVHLDGKGAVDMAKDIHAVKISPIHYGTFPLGAKTDITDLQCLINSCTEEEREDILVLPVGGRIDWNGEKFAVAEA